MTRKQTVYRDVKFSELPIEYTKGWEKCTLSLSLLWWMKLRALQWYFPALRCAHQGGHYFRTAAGQRDELVCSFGEFIPFKLSSDAHWNSRINVENSWTVYYDPHLFNDPHGCNGIQTSVLCIVLKMERFTKWEWSSGRTYDIYCHTIASVYIVRIPAIIHQQLYNLVTTCFVVVHVFWTNFLLIPTILHVIVFALKV
jgi:hypothetical protein